MPKGKDTAHRSRQIVIDASIARAAGGIGADSQVSRSCRDLLTAILQICHRIVICDCIGAEWKRHKSNFARKWLVSMFARKKVTHPDTAPLETLDLRICNAIECEKDREAAEKDIHLIVAALATDRIVLSSDKEAQRIFGAVCEHLPELKDLDWADPDTDIVPLIDWLSRGAPGGEFPLKRSQIPDKTGGGSE